MNNENEFDRKKPVFHDTKGRRRHYLSYLSILGATVVTVLLTFFVISVLINPFLPQIKLKPADAKLAEEFTAIGSVRELPDGRVLLDRKSVV